MEKTHNEIFAELQEKYLATRESSILGKMYVVCREMQTHYISSYCKKHGLRFSYDDFEDKVEYATMFVIEKYLTNPKFKVDKLSAYAYFGATKALFEHKDEEMMTESLDAYIENNGGEI